jgi:hypothetical protein
LPPHELGAALAAEFIQTMWTADRLGHDASALFQDLDDWCPTRPKKFKRPPWWPPIPEPDPEPDWFVDFHLGFAARLAAAADGMNEGKVKELADKAIDRSLGAIEGTKF